MSSIYEFKKHTTMYGYNKRRLRQNLSLLKTDDLKDLNSRADWSTLAVGILPLHDH